MTETIRAAVIGVGHLGRYHAQKYAALPGCELIGVVDSDSERAESVGGELNVPAYTALESILGRAEAVSIATPTQLHFAVGKACLEAGMHVLIEKPLAATQEQGQTLASLARRHERILQVGYLERFNPAFLACRPRIKGPRFIETLRISPFAGRGVDVDVVLDLMSHDLDLVTSMVDSPIRTLHAVGLSLMTSSTDLAHVHMVFQNGCVANLTASRISAKAERKMRLFQKNRYFSIDFSTPTAREYTTEGRPASETPIVEEPVEVQPGDALLAEIQAFLAAVRGEAPLIVGGEEGLRAMSVAARVMEDIARNTQP
ncbi:MAG: Gfo/Idh/MocA family oxidoreductase [bacterium]